MCQEQPLYCEKTMFYVSIFTLLSLTPVFHQSFTPLFSFVLRVLTVPGQKFMGTGHGHRAV